MCDDSSMLTLYLLFYAFNLWVYCRPLFLSVQKRSMKFTAIHQNVNTILQPCAMAWLCVSYGHAQKGHKYPHVETNSTRL